MFLQQVAEKAVFLIPPGEGEKVEKKTMKKRATWKSCCILMSLAIAVAPVVYATDQEPIRTAKAIGEDPTTPPTAPTAPKKTTKPTTTPTSPVKPAVPAAGQTAEAATEPAKVSKAAIYIGIGVAVLLAAGGGGGGGGSSTPPHP